MAQSIEKNKLEAKISRSRALMQKINVLYTRDGSDAPPIESLEEKDDFNVKLFFGKSGNENIDWEHPGVESIIRMWYEIVKFLKGKVRNNIIKEGSNDGNNAAHNTTIRSALSDAAKMFVDGKAFEAGFFIGYEGLDREVNNASGRTRAELSQILNKGRKGDFQVPMTDGWPSLANKQNMEVISSTFTNNRDTYRYFDSSSSPPKWREKFPDDDPNSVTYLIDDIIEIIGQRSSLGEKSTSEIGKNFEQLISQGYIHNSVLGRRFCDVYPEKTTTYRITIDDPEGEGGGVSYSYEYEYSYGDGTYDKQQSLTSGSSGSVFSGMEEWDVPSGLNASNAFDYWDSRINSKLQQIKNLFDDTRRFLNYTKVNDDTYMINPNIPPGKDEAWAMQNKIASELNDAEAVIDSFLDDISDYYSGGESTNSSGRDYLNNRLDTFLSELNDIKSTVSTIANTIDDNTTNSGLMINKPIFGSVDDPGTLYGLRFLATRMIIDATDGSKTAVESIGTAIIMMDKKVKKTEEELEMYGVPTSEWIYTPEIVGIEPYYRLNQATMEMEVAGWMVIWAGQDHCSGYKLQKSLTYDPSTEEGYDPIHGGTAFEPIIPDGQTYTVVDRDANTGKVLMYYIDKEVGPDQKPYYIAKAFDDGEGEKNPPDYNRIATESLWSEPKNADDIEAPESKQERPRRVYDPKEPVRVNRAASIPPNTLAWTTNWKGSEAENIDRTVFKSEVPFDSIGSNLMVFVNERFKNPDKNGETNDYWLDDTYTIRFHESVEPDDEVNLHVFIRSFEGKEQCVDVWYDLEDEKPNNLESDTVAYVRDTRKYYKWDGSVWEEISDPCAGDVDQWKDSVEEFDELPTTGNSDGDIRLVLDENVIYRWNGNLDEWLMISGSAGTGYWKTPVDTTDELPVSSNNQNGEIRFVIETGTLYRWNAGEEEWVALEMSGGGGASAVWGQPVPTFDDLPDPATQLNEVRLVIDEAKMYLWDARNAEWKPIYAEAMMNHSDLMDMSEDEEYHDDRYYREDEMDTILHDIRERVNYLEELKPRDAQELSGDFTITGTKFYGGYLSHGDFLRYDTLVPEQYFPYITKDVNFVLHNDNLEQFKDADKGVLKLYINDEEVDTFDLGSHFVEDEREDGQSYCPASGESEKIVISSVQPYNDYPTYQRGDFELHFVEEDFEDGENKIKLIHTLEVDDDLTEDRTTNEFIFFFDSNKSYRGFQFINVELTELNSSKYLSGIRYASIDDKLNMSFTAERMFNNTYTLPTQVEVDATDFSMGKFEISHESPETSTVEPRVGNQYEFYSTITLSDENIYSIDPELHLVPYSAFGKDPEIKWSDSNILINTVTQKSNNKNEYFLDEVYRLPDDDYDTVISNFTNLWDSSKKLTSGELQCFDGLIYPQELFNHYYPEQQVDYRNFTEEASYLRAFYDSEPHNNGMLFIDGFKYGDDGIKVELKLPGQTGWLDLTKMYNSATFEGEDSDGCLMKVEGNSSFYFTTGSFSTAHSNNLIIMRISFVATGIQTLRSEKINQVTINW